MLISMLSADPNWKQQQTSVTRRFLLSMCAIGIAVVLLGYPLLNFGIALLTPPVFEYVNLPFPTCDPDVLSESPSISDCVPPRRPFRPGEVVPFIVYRVAQEPFSSSDHLIPYTAARSLHKSGSSLLFNLDSLATTVPANGYTTAVTLAHALPAQLPAGTYYLEGVATVYGRYKISTSYFRTADFVVEAKQSQPLD